MIAAGGVFHAPDCYLAELGGGVPSDVSKVSKEFSLVIAVDVISRETRATKAHTAIRNVRGGVPLTV